MLLDESKIKSRTAWAIIVGLITWLGVLYPKVLSFEQASATSIENKIKIQKIQSILLQIKESQIRTETDISHIKDKLKDWEDL